MPARPYTSPLEEQDAATEKSWERPFQGDVVTGLKMYIDNHYKSSRLGEYAHFCALIQSAGMGKSRTVDELAKDCFVIPLNLCATSTGYPPADSSARDYLTSPGSKDDAYDRVCAFLESLFDHTTSIILGFDGQPDYAEFARRFRWCMTEGQTMQGHNQFRKNFYKRVVEMAKHRLDGPIPTSSFPPYTALNKLGQALELSTKFSAPSTKGQQKVKPYKSLELVVLAFDEAQTIMITRRQQSAHEKWSVFEELREALQRLQSLPLFSLFLSTSTKTTLPTSAVQEDQDYRSMRIIVPKLAIIRPYTDFGFDTLARVIAADGSWSLEQLTEDSQMFSLGRPLFAARYMEGSNLVKQEIIHFAATKLLNDDHSIDELSDRQVLACLSQRLPIEFNPTNRLSQEQEREQVEAHLRICLQIDSHFEAITTSSSEPILSEAAYFIMQKGSFNAAKALKSVIESFSISQGYRGVLLVLLLLTLARDSAVGPADNFGRPITGRRWFGLADFLYGHLFRQQTLGSILVNKKSLMALRDLSKDFSNAQLHFNHFVKVFEYGGIDLESLLLLQGRGAAVLCVNLTGIDAINVFLKDGTKLGQENAGLTLYQIWNDTMYSDSTEPVQIRFDAMDPYGLGILEEGDHAVPLIKIVFVLAAKKPALHVVRHAPTDAYPAVVYQIWCAGISPDFLEPIRVQEVAIFDSLLEASYSWKEIFKTTSEITANLRKSATPGVAQDDGHYSRWASHP